MHALDAADPQAGKDAILKAIQDKDETALASISSFWNSGFNFTEMPADTDLVVSNGPYTITDFVADQYVTLTGEPELRGRPQAAGRGDHGPVHHRSARGRPGAPER